MILQKILETNLFPDWLIRMGIRNSNQKRLKEIYMKNIEERQQYLSDFIENLRESPLAVHMDDANRQHYELPPRFFELVLGKCLKYSASSWLPNVTNLDEAEIASLHLAATRAEIKNKQKILELGCGWGSLTLFLAEQFPDSEIIGVSNSNSQRLYIQNIIKKKGLKNIKIFTKNINKFQSKEKFDRIVSIEMFEHLRNYEKIFTKLDQLTKPNAKLFIHVFAHREIPYLFQVKDESDWMSKYFFTGGTMPSSNLFLHFCHPFQCERQWAVSGIHYHKTSEAWLKNMDLHKKEIHEVFVEVYGIKEANKWVSYWRIFFMAVSELFKTNHGSEWLVNHYLFKK